MNAKPKDRIASLSRQLFSLKRLKDDLEEKLKNVNEQIAQIAEQDLVNLMRETEVEKISLEGLGTVYIQDVFYASVLKDDRPALYAWLRKNKHKSLIQDWVFPQTLTAFCKEQAEKNAKLPDFVKVTVVPTARTRAQ